MATAISMAKVTENNMASRIIPGISLRAFWDLGESGWKAGMDENIWRLSFLVQSRVLGVVTELPIDPEEGDRYILNDDSSPYDQYILIYDQALWVPFEPQDRFVVFNTENDSLMYFNQAMNIWISLISPEAIKEAYESNENTNEFTDDEKAKLNGIEDDATADMSAAEIKAAYESNINTNAFTDAEKAKLSGLSSSRFLGIYPTLSNLQAAHPAPSAGSFAYVDLGPTADIMSYIWDANSTKYVPQASGNTQETPESVKEKYETNDDTNAFTDAYKDRLDGLDDELNGYQPAGDYLVEGAQIPWTDITDKPTFFSGAYSDLTGLPTLFSGSWGDLSGKPSDFPPSAHTHAYSSLTGLPSLFDGTWSSLSGKPSTFTPSTHTHAYGDLTGLPSLFSGVYGDLSGKPVRFHNIVMFVSGKPEDAEKLFIMKSVVDFQIVEDFIGSTAIAEVASVGTVVFSITKNGVEFGTITFTSSATGVFASAADTTIAIGDVFGIIAPATADGAMQDISIAINGELL